MLQYYCNPSITMYCILFAVKSSCFSGIIQFTTLKVFWQIFVTTCLNMASVMQKLHEIFFWNEGKDVKQQNFFTTNNKQYTVPACTLCTQQSNYILKTESLLHKSIARCYQYTWMHLRSSRQIIQEPSGITSHLKAITSTMADPFCIGTVTLKYQNTIIVKSGTDYILLQLLFNCQVHFFSKIHVIVAHFTFGITNSCNVTSRHCLG